MGCTDGKEKMIDFLIATFIFICVFVYRKRICTKTFFKKQQSSFVDFDLKYKKEILKNTKENIGQRYFLFFTHYNISIGDLRL